MDSPADNQEVLDHFQGLPNTLDELLELMHDLQAKADMCEGIDPAVSCTPQALCAVLSMHCRMCVLCHLCFIVLQVVHEYDDRKKQIESMRQQVKATRTARIVVN